MTLLIYPYGHFPRCFQFTESRDNIPPVQPRKGAKIIGLTGSNARPVELTHRRFEHRPQLCAVRERDMGANHPHCTVAEDAVWLTVGAEFKPAAFRLWSIRGDTGDLKGTGIRNKAVPTTAGQADRAVGTNFVKILPDGRTLTIREIIFIPAAALYPSARVRWKAGYESRKGILQVSNRADALETAPGEPGTEPQQVHMGVVEAGGHELPAQVAEPIIRARTGEQLFRLSNLRKNTVTDSESIRIPAGAEQTGVIIDRFHKSLPFTVIFPIVPHPAAFVNKRSACAPLFALFGRVPTASIVRVTT